MVAVAIDKDKGSQYALKWAIDHLLSKGQSVTLLHVKLRPSSSNPSANSGGLTESQARELFLPFRCFCTRKNIKCNEVVVEDIDIPKAICDFVRIQSIGTLVLSSSSKNAFVRFRSSDVASIVTKAAPEFCTVYVIAKGKVSSVRTATAPLTSPSPRSYLQNQSNPLSNPGSYSQNQSNPLSNPGSYLQNQSNPLSNPGSYLQNHSNPLSNPGEPRSAPHSSPSPRAKDGAPFMPRNLTMDDNDIKSPFTRAKNANRSYGEASGLDSDISFVSSGRPSTDRMFPSLFDNQDMGTTPQLSFNSDMENRSFGSPFSGSQLDDPNSSFGFSSSSLESPSMSWQSSQNLDEVEAEMRRLKQELKQTMDMYSTACKEALSAKQKAVELHRWKVEEEQRLEEARLAEEAALALAEREKAKCRAAMEAAETAQRIAELEAQKRINAEMKALKESQERKKAMDALAQGDIRYRKYTIEEIEEATDNFADARKIGEGGYGPVYKCYLDHTEVAIKALRPDAAQGRSQFQQEVEVLSCIRHPNMVLLLGACPEYGCLVYEYMANGSLDDRLFRRGNTPVLSWQLRFRIAAEIGTGLLFLHQTKPEPLVHRDLKPGNILLDRNFVSKISDVGLARLVPPSVADTVTQYRMTSAAGTFCYIDPEYQQTGMLGIKSDIYSLGIMLLQIITAKPPMGLTHHVERAIEKGTFAEMLDPAVTDWPIQEALDFAKISLKCAELRRKDRPDLGNIVLPELNRLRDFAEERMPNSIMMCGSPMYSPGPNKFFSTAQDTMSDRQFRHSRHDSPSPHSSAT